VARLVNEGRGDGASSGWSLGGKGGLTHAVDGSVASAAAEALVGAVACALDLGLQGAEQLKEEGLDDVVGFGALELGSSPVHEEVVVASIVSGEGVGPLGGVLVGHVGEVVLGQLVHGAGGVAVDVAGLAEVGLLQEVVDVLSATLDLAAAESARSVRDLLDDGAVRPPAEVTEALHQGLHASCGRNLAASFLHVFHAVLHAGSPVALVPDAGVHPFVPLVGLALGRKYVVLELVQDLGEFVGLGGRGRGAVGLGNKEQSNGATQHGWLTGND
jgi:hypothetical protein